MTATVNLRANPLARAFNRLVGTAGEREHGFQRFLETNTEFLITPFLLNHGLHFESVIAKLPLGQGLITDFAYLTKSSVQWRLVLVEIEKPCTQLFQADKRQITPHSDFTRCLSQIAAWRDAVERDADSVINRVAAIRRPLSRNNVDVKYVLVAGRSPGEHNDQRIPDRLRQLGGNDLQILTFDSLLRHYLDGRGQRKNIVTVERTGFRMKYLNTVPGAMFNYVFPHELTLKKDQEDLLMRWGISVKQWRAGQRPEVVRRRGSSLKRRSG
jgi:hypothetical protein